ncbi:MAG: Gfo/Idh/MocA family oxidoreductase [Actinomycetota bacterium]|nr:Gfo/Idh/MocA family oxidoreductase [Actinomycetota bacterium]
MTLLRAALVGYGSAGRGIHGPLLRATGFEVPYVVTRDAERARAAGKELGARALADVGEVATRAGEVDVAVVASPTAAHVANALTLVEAGVPVVVDKPLGVDASSARRLVELAAARRVPLTVFHNRRWDSEHRTLARVLEDGRLGEVLRYEARFERWRPTPKDRWRERLPAAEGGGLLLDLGSHLVDGALTLFGPAVAVYAETAAVTTVGEDVVFLALTHASGVRSHLGATTLAGHPGPRARVLGTAGAYLVQDVDGEATAYGGWTDEAGTRGWLVTGDERTAVPRVPGEWGSFYRELADALRGEGGLPVAARDALAVMEVLDAAQRSAASGDVVRPVAPGGRS